MPFPGPEAGRYPFYYPPMRTRLVLSDVQMPDGRQWRFLGSGTVSNRYGEDRHVWRFEGACRVCGRLFEMSTMAARPARRAGAFGLVHCPTHRLHVGRPSPTPKPIAERFRTRHGRAWQVWTLIDQVWHRTRRGELLRLGVYQGLCFSCGSDFEVRSKLHRRGATVGSFLRIVRCKSCRERGFKPLV